MFPTWLLSPFQSVATRLWSRRKSLKVEFSTSFIPGWTNVPQATLSAVNIGERRVVLNACGLKVDKQELSVIPDSSSPALPCTLEDGDKVTTWISLEKVRAVLREIGQRGHSMVRCYFVDTTGGVHESPEVRLGVDEPPPGPDDARGTVRTRG